MRALGRSFDDLSCSKLSYLNFSYLLFPVFSHGVRALIAIAMVPGFAGTANAAAVSGQGTWETTLQARDFDGNAATIEGYYDTAVGITWLADANYGRAAGTTMDWFDSNAWAAGLNVNGITGWRLPTVSPIDGTTEDDYNASTVGTEDYGFNVSAPGTLYAGSTASEMAHLFYNTLGNKGFCDPAMPSDFAHCPEQAGWGLSNTGPFANVQTPSGYWSATTFAPDPLGAWLFSFYNGVQTYSHKSNYFFAWAVHDGDAGASIVPVPAAAWLFGSGLIGLLGMSRKRRC